MEEFNLTLNNYLERKEGANKRYNFFREMFNFSNERYLHSSFIAMLLSQEDKTYLHYFLELLSAPKTEDTPVKVINKNQFKLERAKWDEATINPNKDDHSEHKDIDILLRWKKEKTAIIIENKTFSSDRNGKYPQLVSYAKVLESEGYDKDHIYLVYLNFRGQLPTKIENFKEYNLSIISYDNFIIKWLKECVKHESNNKELDWIINQYLEFTEANLNTRAEAMELMEILDQDITAALEAYTSDSSSNLKNKETFKTMMIHVRWEVINDVIYSIINTLASRPGINLDITTQERNINNQIISASKINRDHARMIFQFEYHREDYYICNDGNGFSIGKCRRESQDDYIIIPGLDLQKFGNKETFELINSEVRKQYIARLVDQLLSGLSRLSEKK